MRHVSKRVGLVALALWTSQSLGASGSCTKPVYLTFDTGHMEIAPLVADVLKRQDVRVTFFLANEKTRTNGSSLDQQWRPWWQARAQEGHDFASHTYDHVYWIADLPNNQFKMRPSAGPNKGKTSIFTGQQYCDELDRSAKRFKEMTGQTMLPLFRAAGGKTSPALLKAAAQCGYQHVGWSAAGFLGDELPSDHYPNQRLLEQALKNIKAGDILVAHLGIWSRKDPWAPTVLEPLIVGLKQNGFCFKTISEHPNYVAYIKK